MKITEITISKRFTKNLGNFQSMTAEVSMTAVIEDGEEYNEVYEELRAEVNEAIKREIK